MERLVDHCRTAKQRALIQVLYEGGMRIGELLNIRLHHVQLRRFDPADPSKKIFVLGLPFSKTKPRTIGLGMHASIK